MKKQLKYIYQPDLANKFLISNALFLQKDIKSLKLEFSYVFSSYNAYNPMIIKLLPTLESIGFIKPKYKNQYIKFTYKKKRLVTKVLLTINFQDPIFEFFLFCPKMPLGPKVISSHRATEYFISPTYPSTLLFPGWERKPILAFNIPINTRRMKFFHKTAYLD